MSFADLKYYLARLLSKKPSAVRNSVIHKTAAVGNGAQVVGSHIGKYSYIYGSSLIETKMGAFCSVASGCSIGGGRHPTDWVSTSPVFYKGRNVLKTNFSQNAFEEYAQTTIGNDVWIGAKCMIKGGVTIGDGAIIGMGSVVTHDVPPYEIWAGNPAKCIRKRFDDETVEKLLQLQWWNWDDEKLAKYCDLFSDPAALLAKLEEEA